MSPIGVQWGPYYKEILITLLIYRGNSINSQKRVTTPLIADAQSVVIHKNPNLKQGDIFIKNWMTCSINVTIVDMDHQLGI